MDCKDKTARTAQETTGHVTDLQPNIIRGENLTPKQATVAGKKLPLRGGNLEQDQAGGGSWSRRGELGQGGGADTHPSEISASREVDTLTHMVLVLGTAK